MIKNNSLSALTTDVEAPKFVRVRHVGVELASLFNLKQGQVCEWQGKLVVRCPVCARLIVSSAGVNWNGGLPGSIGTLQCPCSACKFAFYLRDGAVCYSAEAAVWKQPTKEQRR